MQIEYLGDEEKLLFHWPNVPYKGGSDGGAGGAWALPLFETLFKNSMLLENNGDCGFQ